MANPTEARSERGTMAGRRQSPNRKGNIPGGLRFLCSNLSGEPERVDVSRQPVGGRGFENARGRRRRRARRSGGEGNGWVNWSELATFLHDAREALAQSIHRLLGSR
jgi:hypothetical protein